MYFELDICFWRDLRGFEYVRHHFFVGRVHKKTGLKLKIMDVIYPNTLCWMFGDMLWMPVKWMPYDQGLLTIGLVSLNKALLNPYYYFFLFFFWGGTWPGGVG